MTDQDIGNFDTQQLGFSKINLPFERRLDGTAWSLYFNYFSISLTLKCSFWKRMEFYSALVISNTPVAEQLYGLNLVYRNECTGTFQWKNKNILTQSLSHLTHKLLGSCQNWIICFLGKEYLLEMYGLNK